MKQTRRTLVLERRDKALELYIANGRAKIAEVSDNTLWGWEMD